MTPLEEQIRAAIDRRAHNRIALSSNDRDDLARAVVAVLPTADVSDEAITEALAEAWWEDGRKGATPGVLPPWAELDGTWAEQREGCQSAVAFLVPTVRALLDAQAAAHAGRVASLEREVRSVVHQRDQAMRDATIAATAHAAEVEALRGEVERWESGQRTRSAPALPSWPSAINIAAELVRHQTGEDDTLDALLRTAGVALKDIDRIARVETDRAKTAEAEVEALRAENERLKTELARGVVEMARLVRDRDRAVAEALEHAAQKIEEAVEFRSNPAKYAAARIVRGLIPEPDLGVWTQEQVDSINERAARRAEALAPLIEGDTDD